MNDHRFAIRVLLAATLLGLVTGCPQQPVRPDLSQTTPAQQEALSRAATLDAGGDLDAAAAIYTQLAEAARPPLRDELLVRAADARVRARQPDTARTLLAGVHRDKLSPDAALLARLVEAEILMLRAQAAEALTALTPRPGADTPVALRIRYLRDRADALRGSGNLVDSAGELSELDLLLSDREQRINNQLQLVQTLAALSDAVLQQLQPASPGLLAGWMDLALLLKASPQRQEAAARFQRWRETHPSHPVLPELIDRYFGGFDDDMSQFRKVAVLLPSSGHFGNAAAALREGMLAAYYAADPTRRPELLFFDTSSPADVWPLLQQAIAAGAEAAIGPLQKQSVEQIAQAGELPIPVLALNRIQLTSAPPANLYQFGLAPEDEARQAARKAWLDGAVNAVALVPENEWGQRMLDSFRDEWEALGGRLAMYQTYDPAMSDFSEPILKLLDLSGSEARHQALMRALGQRLEFEPTRRQDLDALFLAASAGKARELWPQLLFHRAADLPGYATSHINERRFTSPQDLDLVGLAFPDIPWLLAPAGRSPVSVDELPPDLGVDQGAIGRLFAMGLDSYRLIPALQRLRDYPQTSLPGATGDLSLDRLNQVHRRLVWARITAQGPQPLGFTPQIPVFGASRDPHARDTRMNSTPEQRNGHIR